MAKAQNGRLAKGSGKGEPSALPQAVDDAVTVSGNATGNAVHKVSVSSLLANDKGGQAKSLYSVDSSGAGIVAISSDGKEITYDTNGAFDHLAIGETATDSFHYTIRMGNGALSTATVTVTVTGTADGPQADQPSIINVTNGGTGENYYRALSQDGSKLIFATVNDPDSAPWLQDIFIYDLNVGNTTPISVLSSLWVDEYTISADGSTVAFKSWRDPLDLDTFHVAGAHIYLYDTETGAVRSVTEDAVHVSFSPMFSVDGSTLVFTSQASNLNGIDENGYIWDESGKRPDVIVHDLSTGVNINVTDDGNWDWYHFAEVVSTDGSKVAYRSETDPFPHDRDYSAPYFQDRDIFVYDRTSGESIKVADGAFNAEDGTGVSVSAVAFVDNDSKLVLIRGEGSDTAAEVLLYDLGTHGTTIVGRAAGPLHVSAHGSTIVYSTAGYTVVDNQVDPYGTLGDVFAYDVATGVTTSITEGANGGVAGLQLSADGSRLIFSSNATNLIEGHNDLNGDIVDVFIFDMSSGDMDNITDWGDGDSHAAGISADGSRVVFTSYASNLVEGEIDTNGNGPDVFVFEI